MVHRWIPCHREPLKRSHVDKTIVLLKIGERYVPIVEAAIQELPAKGASEGGGGEDSSSRAKSCEPTGDQLQQESAM